MTQAEFTDLLDALKSLTPEQLEQLRREVDASLVPASAEASLLTDEQRRDQELQRRLFESGLLNEIKSSSRIATASERFGPVSIEGEPLSETVIRERR